MNDIVSTQTLLAARLGFDITDYHVIPYFNLENELIRAAINGNLDEIKLILFVGFDMHKTYYLYCVYYSENFTEDELLLKISAAHGHLNVVEYLVSRGANIHSQSEAALRSAAQSGHLDVVKYLVSKGADTHALSEYALRAAAENKHLDVVNYLVNQTTNPYELFNKQIKNTLANDNSDSKESETGEY